jgi:hypothetical protein
MIVEYRRIEDLGDGTGEPGLSNEFAGPMHVVGAHHDIGPWRPLLHDLAIFLGQTPGHHDLAAFLLCLPRTKVTEISVEPIVGVLADAAGVEHDDIGVVLRIDGDETIGIEQPGDALGIVFVHLTPVGVHDVAAGHRTEATRAIRSQSGRRMLPSASSAKPGLCANSHR